MSKWLEDDIAFTNYEGEVLTSEFKYNQFGGLELEWKLFTNDPRIPEWHERFTVGDKWDVEDGGKRIMAKPGTSGKFHPRSNFGRLLKRTESWLEESGSDPREADVWLGLKVRMEAVKTFTDKDTKEEKFRNFPTVLGRVGVSDVPEPGGYPSTPPLVGVPDLPPEVLSKLIHAAKHEDHAKWMDVVLENAVPVLTDSEIRSTFLQAASKDDGLYQSMRRS